MRTLVLRVPAGDAELAADRLWRAGARAVEERDRRDAAELRTVLADDDRVAVDRVGALPEGWTLDFEDVDERVADTWRAHARPITVNPHLIVRPAWCEPTADRDQVEVAIEPAGAFGLGDHPSTRLAADAAWRLTAPGERVLDVGCGTGVLAIVAARRGASRVVAIDVADAARTATLDNADRNGVADVIEVGTASLDSIDGRFDVVLANILAPTLVAMAPALRRRTSADGHLVVAGVLRSGFEHVVEALAPMRVAGITTLDDWACLELVHAGP